MKHPRQNKLIIHGRGTGDLSDEDVEKRAQEIAVIQGRSADQVWEDDRTQALAELQGETLPESPDTEGESRGTLSRDPREPVSIPGRQIFNIEGDDEAVVVERLTREGVDEASHDQMLASRRREHRQARN